MKQYSDMTNKELVARIVELDGALQASWVDTVHRGGGADAGFPFEGYWSHKFIRSVRAAMRNLVQAGYWEWHKAGREFYARPIEKDVT